MKIPVSVIITTKNEEPRLARCLATLNDFAEIIVVDSASTDNTAAIARDHGARAVNFIWAGTYPKKRQWCLNILDLAHDWVFFVDADEILTPALIDEIRALALDRNPACAGYFVLGQYVFDGAPLRFGLRNNKLALFDRRKIHFPPVDDLDIAGMGEMEGHYQPVLKPGYQREKIGQLRKPLLHEAYSNHTDWLARHKRYAAWERAMDQRRAWPAEATKTRAVLKRLFKALPCRGLVAFVHCYIWKLGILDGARGLAFARSRKTYYDLIQRGA